MRPSSFITALLILSLNLSFVTLSSYSVHAATFYVDDDNCSDSGEGTESEPFCSIQMGINDAVSGDTVQVAAGTYPEKITMKSGVVIQGAGQGDSIIDGISLPEGSRGPLVTADGVDSAAKLDGFTITNGLAMSAGGMYIYNSSPTVSNCTFSGNSAALVPGFGNGGAMSISGTSSPVVTNCSFSGNDGDVNGGGIANWSSSSLTVTNCSFSDNTAQAGGGMYNINSSPMVTNCTFSRNSATVNGLGKGGGMYNINSSPTVSTCTFINNQAHMNGGGMYIEGNTSSPIVTGCTFSGNTITGHELGGGGGGMSFYNYASATITNSTFFQNEAQTTYGGSGLFLNIYSSATVNNCSFSKNNGYSAIWIENNSSVTITNSIMWGDLINLSELDGTSGSFAVTYSDIWGGYAGTGNINKDPKFVDQANGDLHLQQDSPCIDAGDNSVSNLPDTDIDGEARKFDDPNVVDTGSGSAPIVDMGADEYVPEIESFPWEIFYPAFIKKK